MTLREWLDVYTHNGDAQHVCAWRKRAWRAMRPVVERFVADRDANKEQTPYSLLTKINDAAIAERINIGGKRWRQELRKIRDIISSSQELWPTPAKSEADACSIARDAEEEGRTEIALAILEAEAPNRHNRKCPACGAPVGSPCRAIGGTDELIATHAARVAA